MPIRMLACYYHDESEDLLEFIIGYLPTAKINPPKDREKSCTERRSDR